MPHNLVLTRTDFTLGDLVSELARNRPRKTAAVDGHIRVSYAELEDRVNRLVNAVAPRVDAGDTIAWLGQNSYRALETFLASAKLGAIFCPLNWRGSADELQFALRDLDPKVVVWQRSEMGTAVQRGRERHTGEALWVEHYDLGDDPYENLLASSSPMELERAVDPAGAVLAIYTAAFEGTPGAAMLSHLALLVQGLVIGSLHGVTADSVCLTSTPLFHIAAFLLLDATLMYGGTNVFVPRAEPLAICRAIEAERVSHAIVFPPTMEKIRELAREQSFDLSSLFSGPQIDARSTMLTPTDAPWARLPGGYGQTEVGGLITFAALAPDSAIQGAGRPAPIAAVRIVDDEGIEAPVGEVGEIVVRGLTAMTGYFHRDETNTQRRQGGWHHTNDLGRRNEDGTVSFVGVRTKLIKSGGENIYPAEVEARLSRHPAVAEACVIGVPDERWRQSVHAVVVLRDGWSASEEELIAHCAAGIASYKKPHAVSFAQSLPRTPTGSVDRDAVDESFGGGGYPGT